MKYHYEALNDQTFQKFVQALLVAVHPETICLPVRQPDGGRDAILYHAAVDRKSFVVFQVKFSINPKDKTERDVIDSLIKSEQDKVNTLIKKGATHYYFITNVQASGHPESGSIDKVNKTLTDAFSIPSFVWWRDDLDARLDNTSDIKWSYPEICRATDVLQFLLQRPEARTEIEATRAITAYIGKQHGDDRDVKFKQVELKRRITDLFVDIPIGHKASRRERGRAQSDTRELRQVEEHLDQLYEYEDYDDDDYPSSHKGLAAGFLLHMPFGKGVSRFVLEGAPGQGKSTVTQFLCQVNRLKFLPARRSDLGKVSEVFVTAPMRTPFRIDLRDYAAWVSGRHPYAKQGEVAPPEEGQRSLESFLIMQIAWNAGGLALTQHELIDFFVRAHSVIILDGFDEVADIGSRARVVEEICAAADRLDAHALSLQIIVTSRPAAFANSPGFPEDDWVHLELNDLKWINIKAYQRKWAEAQDLAPDEEIALAGTLEEKLRQAHLRDLSRNPMQLAILLQLMHVQGAALPDKRTALYEEYMKIFLNREVEKKQISGDHRELILSIHGLLAWILQVQAETGRGSGSITMDELKMEVASYLASEEHDPDLAETLLTGTVERVGALVSRVQGTLEFEVQPLREYFAARHLHKTAPYSPPGRPRTGTRPDRFSALVRSSYWTNVTRFFCGFYDVGELPSLVDELMGIGEEREYKLITQPRRLAMMLLADYVFTQSPKSMRRLIGFISRDSDLQRLVGTDSMQGQRGMRLPEGAGGKQLFDVCALKLQTEKDPIYRQELRRVMARNGGVDRLKEFWYGARANEGFGKDSLSEARDLNLVNEFDAKEIREFTIEDPKAQVRWLAEANMYDQITKDVDLYSEACRAFFNFEIGFGYQRPSRDTQSNSLVVLTELLHPYMLAELFSIPRERRAEFGRRDYLRQEQREPIGVEHGKPKELVDFMEFVAKLMDGSWGRWRRELDPWKDLVNRGYELAQGGRLFSVLAIVSMAVSTNSENSAESDVGEGHRVDELVDKFAWKRNLYWTEEGFRPSQGLVERLYFARGKATEAGWWTRELEKSEGEGRIILLAALMCWGSAEVVGELFAEIGDALDELDDESWSWFWNLFALAISAAKSQAEELGEEWFRMGDRFTERFAIAMTRRLAKGADRRAVARNCFYSYKGGDRRILQISAEWEVQSEADGEVDWTFVSHLSELARAHGVRVLFSRSRMLQQVKVPLDVASSVLKCCENHNRQFVALCEWTFSADVARRAAKVSTVAENEMWFIEGTDKLDGKGERAE